MALTEPVLEVRDLWFRYPGGEPVLQGVSFSVRRGERVAILGANGVGKSTLLHLLIGLQRPESGEVLVYETPVREPHLKAIRRRVGLVFQNPDDQLFMPTLLEDVAFGPCNYGVAREEALEAARALLERFRLTSHAAHSGHRLSGGEKRLAALATVLALEPSILALDEPTGGLDPGWRCRLADALSMIEWDALLMATHDLAWVSKVAHRALVLFDGRIRLDGPAREVLQNASALADCGLPPHC
ncbi:MAG: ABC transporter ATP-binding protein [Limnochordaceae bacterium]|nr:ABC transporter ATP-binding protein [Limnochordaceae bacterium]